MGWDRTRGRPTRAINHGEDTLGHLFLRLGRRGGMESAGAGKSKTRPRNWLPPTETAETGALAA